jgi:hypothetical protein
MKAVETLNQMQRLTGYGVNYKSLRNNTSTAR